jgi:hypothetical protein
VSAPSVEQMRETLRRERQRVDGAGELSTGTGAIAVMVAIWVAAELANKKMRG